MDMANLGECKHCGVAFEAAPSATNQSFCSANCRDTWWNESRSTQMTTGEKTSKIFGQSPDFTLTDIEASWLACAVDGEGTIGIWRERRPKNRSGYRYRPVVQVCNTNWDFAATVKKLVDGYAYADTPKRDSGHKKLYRVNVSRRAVPNTIEQIMPYLIIKPRQAKIVLQFCRAVENAPVRASEDHEIFEQLYLECKELNRRGA